jgi:hypothetical protein
VSRRLLFLALIPVFLFVAGCGGSSHTSSTISATAPIGSATTSATPTTSSTTSTSATSTGATSSPAPQSSNVRVPATFLILPNGRMNPPQIAVPAGLPVELTVAGAGHEAHRVVAAGHSLSVPPGGRASVRITGLKKGHYVIQVDGRSAGLLVIGAQPGP